MSVIFSTNLVPAADRRAAWEWNARRFCGDCRFHFPNRREFHGSIETKKLGNLELSLFASSSLSFTKFPIRTSHSDSHCTVITQLQGDRTYSQNGRAVTLRAGDSTLIDSALPWSSECRGNCMRLYVRTPRLIVEELFRTKVVPSGSYIAGSSSLGATLFHLANSLYHRADTLTEEEGAALIDAYLDALAGGLSCPKGDCSRSWHAPHLYERVAKFIEKHLADPGLGPTIIAAELGISTRHLHRLFANRGTTPGEWIREFRLERCRADLADPSLRGRSVTEVAFSWGFCDSAHFSHAFKKRFGISPRAFRYQAWAGSWNKTSPDFHTRGFLAGAQQSEPN